MSRKKKIWAVCAGVALLAIIAVASVQSSRKNAVLVQASRIERRDVLTSTVSASGEIRAKEFVDLQSEIAGIITELMVREGDRVQKGDVLLHIDPIQTAADESARRAGYEAALADARAQDFLVMNAEANLMRDEASLRSARAELTQAENNFARAQSKFRRQQQLNEDGLISHDDYEAAQNELQSARSRLEVAKAQVAQIENQVQAARNTIEQSRISAAASRARAKSSEADLVKSRDQLRKTKLRSPISGVITQLLVEKGERAQPGIMSNPEATLMTIADLSVIQAEIKVDETDVVNLSLGDAAKVKVDALPNEVFEGEVTEIGNSPIKSSGATQEAKDFKVIITLKNPSPKLRPGMSCTGEITTDTKHNVLVIPIQALTARDVEVDKDGNYIEPDLSKKKRESVARADTARNDGRQKKELEGIFIINENRIARFRPIRTGIMGESEIEVLDALKEGTQIVSGSYQTLRTLKDGSLVKVETTSSKSSPRR
jgi:HlyD family secretion protein